MEENIEIKTDLTVREIEKALIKKFRKPIWSKFTRAIRDYKLVEDGDKIAVAISGGKDSLILAKALQEIQRHGLIKFELEFIAMDPGFDEKNRKILENVCEKMGIPLKIFESNVFKVAQFMGKEKPCYMCARMRRGFLYQCAEELDCNKLALGHHFNDVIETTLMNIIFASEFKTMRPKLNSTNFKGMQLIRPLYYVKEEEIIKYFNYINVHEFVTGCAIASKAENTNRLVVKNLVNDLNKINPNADASIFKSAGNVNLEQILGYRVNGEKIGYLEEGYLKGIKDEHN